MSIKKKRRIKFVSLALAPALLIALMAIAVTIGMGTSAVADPAPCAACHNNTSLITGKLAQWETSGHGTGEAFAGEGPNKSCTGCHSGGGFSAMVAAGLEPNSSALVGDLNPTRQDCRACHQVHNTYTGVDWALETVADVNFFAQPGQKFSGGEGNLCAKCHQPRKAPTASVNGTVSGITNRYGPHHGPQSSFMIGIGGAGSAAAGQYSPHYADADAGTPGIQNRVANTCVGCHMGANDNHSYEPDVATCKVCHTTATNFDVNGVQTAVQTKSDQLKGLLVTAGVLTCTTDAEGVESCNPPTASFSAPENTAFALWNWILIAKEDGSKGVHNPDYALNLLDASLAAMGA